MRVALSKTFAVLAFLWSAGVMIFWAVGMVSSLREYGLALLNPFDIGNIVGMIISIVLFSLAMAPTLALMWISERLGPRQVA